LIRAALIVALLTAAIVLAGRAKPHRRILILPAGVVHLSGSWPIGSGVEVRGSGAGSILRMEAPFDGPAALVVGSDVYLHDFTIDGNRSGLEERTGLPPYDTPFARFTRGNGILAEGANGLKIENVRFHDVAGFAVLADRAHHVSLYRLQVADSGSRNAAGRNNATGGILLEEGTSDFRVEQCDLLRILGNGIWTHSLSPSPRDTRGVIARNRFDEIGRDAIQVGHATDVRVYENAGIRIGFPEKAVDMENRAIPVAIDTAGNVESCSYAQNRFEEINGKCIDLDGFHDGEVRGNTCINHGGPEQYRFGNYGIVMNNSNPTMRTQNIRVTENLIEGPLFGGIFVIGSGNVIERNRLLDINRAHCNEEAARFGCYYAAGEPDMLRTAIYLGKGAERPAPAQGNLVENNEITGFKMKTRCTASAPGIPAGANTVRDNTCRDEK
jgi:hypothetical protein